MRILLDMDSILADFYFGILDAYREETGEDCDPEAIAEWDAKLPNGKLINYYFSQEGFFERLKPVEGAIEAMNLWKSEGHDLVIVSAATLTHAPTEKYKWINRHLPWFKRRNVIFAQRKELVKGDVLIDDAPRNAQDYRKAHPEALILGIEYPYNRVDQTGFDVVYKDYRNPRKAWKSIKERVALYSSEERI